MSRDRYTLEMALTYHPGSNLYQLYQVGTATDIHPIGVPFYARDDEDAFKHLQESINKRTCPMCSEAIDGVNKHAGCL